MADRPCDEEQSNKQYIEEAITNCAHWMEKSAIHYALLKEKYDRLVARRARAGLDCDGKPLPQLEPQASSSASGSMHKNKRLRRINKFRRPSMLPAVSETEDDLAEVANQTNVAADQSSSESLKMIPIIQEQCTISEAEDDLAEISSLTYDADQSSSESLEIPPKMLPVNNTGDSNGPLVGRCFTEVAEGKVEDPEEDAMDLGDSQSQDGEVARSPRSNDEPMVFANETSSVESSSDISSEYSYDTESESDSESFFDSGITSQSEMY